MTRGTEPSAQSPALAHKRPGEFDLIVRHFAHLAGEGGFGLIDDAALLQVTPGKALALTQHAIAAGIHFFADDPAGTIANKALRINLADLAAKGATPSAFSLALGLPDDWPDDREQGWIAAFAQALARDCQDYQVKLTGGDLFRAPAGLVISITAWGEIEPSAFKSRLGAMPGDRLYVTGTLGDAALGLKVRQGAGEYYALKGASTLLSHYLKPRPPVSFAPLIAGFASASMALSGGFVGEMEKMARASSVSFEVDGRTLPFSAATREAFAIKDAMRLALTGGGDWQCLFTVAEKDVSAFRAAAGRQKIEVSQIGLAVSGPARVAVRHLPGLDLASAGNSQAHSAERTKK